jgi:hypothetical protein
MQLDASSVAQNLVSAIVGLNAQLQIAVGLLKKVRGAIIPNMNGISPNQ